ncbi:MAG: hypothetical protein HYS74_02180 [Parcubacteria group bacterium]|nr:hypothetical protein [Parcubacteria group bacterium]
MEEELWALRADVEPAERRGVRRRVIHPSILEEASLLDEHTVLVETRCGEPSRKQDDGFCASLPSNSALGAELITLRLVGEASPAVEVRAELGPDGDVCPYRERDSTAPHARLARRPKDGEELMGRPVRGHRKTERRENGRLPLSPESR